MATITYIVNAINRASSVFNDVADSATKMAVAEEAATNASLNLQRAMTLQLAATNRATSALKDLRTAALGAAAAITTTNTATAASSAVAVAALGRWGGLLRVLGNGVTLFGGIGPAFLTSIGPVHLALDVVAEFLAVVLPATVALVGFGAVAGPIFGDIFTRMSQINTVVTATGKNIYPLTGQLQALQKAVQPSVYQLFGEALNLAATHGKDLAGQLAQVGSVLDGLAARAEVALGSGGMDFFFRNAVTDVQQLGDGIGNIFGTLGNVFRQFPGYANILLTVFDNLSRALEGISASPITQTIISWGLAFHGAWLYVGLLATGIQRLIPFLLGGLSTGLIKGASLLANFGSVGTKAAVQLAGLSVVAERAAGLPWGWIGIAAAALGFLIFRLYTAQDAFTSFINKLNSTVASAKASNGIQTLTDAMAKLNAQLATYGTLVSVTIPGSTTTSRDIQGQLTKQTTAAQTLPAVLKPLPPGEHGGPGGITTQGYAGLSGFNPYDFAAAQQYLAEQKKIENETATYKARIQSLVPVYGSVDAVQRAVNASGVSLGEFISKNTNTWAQAQAQIAATSLAYKAMGQSSVEASNDVQVVSRAASDQAQAVAQLNQAWDSYISALTGSQSAQDTFLTGLNTLTTDALSPAAQAAQAANTQLSTLAPTMDGLNAQSIALNAAFTGQVQQAGQLIDAWRTAGLQGKTFTTGVNSIVASLIPFAGTSKEALAQLTGLLDEAGYQGPPTLKAINDWLAQTTNSTQGIADASQAATIQMGLLTTAMQGQGQYIANQLLNDINSAIGAYDGVYKAATNYGNAVAQYGKDSPQAKAAQDQLTMAIVKGGVAAGSTQGQIAALISAALGIPTNVAMQIVAQDEAALQAIAAVQAAADAAARPRTLTFYAYVTGSPAAMAALNSGSSGGAKPQLPGAANGAYISTGAGPRADDNLALVSRGELIVPAHMVSAGAVNHLRGKIPGFASGGTISEPLGLRLRSGSMYGLGESGVEDVVPRGGNKGGSASDALLAELKQQNAYLKSLLDLTAKVPAATGAAVAQASGRGGRPASYSALYSPRG